MNTTRFRELINAAEDGSLRTGEAREFMSLAREACDTHSTAEKQIEMFRALNARELPCGHKVEDLIYGGPTSITKCARCIMAKGK